MKNIKKKKRKVQTVAKKKKIAFGIAYGQAWKNTHRLLEMKVKVAQSCPILCDSMDYSLPVSSVHGSLQARTLEWVAIPFSCGSSQHSNPIQVLDYFAGWFFTIWATRKADRLLVRS